jgi:hypothetical protein
MRQCPTDEDLEQGLTRKWPENKNVNLHVTGENGCFSPCTALGYPTYGGKGISPPSSDATAPYCCPTPPVSSPECRNGPVPKTKYVMAVHSMCANTAYGYAYDDMLGGRTCDPTVTLTMTFCPPQIN